MPGRCQRRSPSPERVSYAPFSEVRPTCKKAQLNDSRETSLRNVPSCHFTEYSGNGTIAVEWQRGHETLPERYNILLSVTHMCKRCGGKELTKPYLNRPTSTRRDGERERATERRKTSDDKITLVRQTCANNDREGAQNGNISRLRR